MENYVHSIPTEIMFGQGQIENLPNVLNRYGKKVLLVYGGGSIKKIGLYDKVISLLKDEHFFIIECPDIEPNPQIESVAKGAQLCKQHHIDVVLAVGGGSTIDASKAIAVGAYHEGDYWEMVTKKEKGRKALPLVVILTLSATGSEFDGVGVISNSKTKEKMGSPFTFPAVSICDPTYTFSVSKYQTAAGSIDIMSHIIEGYFSREEVDLSDGIAETVLKTVIKNLPIALNDPQNYIARGNLMMASTLACSGIPEYGKESLVWSCHAMEHELSAYYDITHGIGLAILTPRWMRYILAKDSSVTKRFVKFANNVWNVYGENDYEVALKGIKALETFFKQSQVPMSLSELNIDNKHFKDMAVHCNRNGRLLHAYVPLTDEDIINIYNACL